MRPPLRRNSLCKRRNANGSVPGASKLLRAKSLRTHKAIKRTERGSRQGTFGGMPAGNSIADCSSAVPQKTQANDVRRTRLAGKAEHQTAEIIGVAPDESHFTSQNKANSGRARRDGLRQNVTFHLESAVKCTKRGPLPMGLKFPFADLTCPEQRRTVGPESVCQVSDFPCGHTKMTIRNGCARRLFAPNSH